MSLIVNLGKNCTHCFWERMAVIIQIDYLKCEILNFFITLNFNSEIPMWEIMREKLATRKSRCTLHIEDIQRQFSFTNTKHCNYTTGLDPLIVLAFTPSSQRQMCDHLAGVISGFVEPLTNGSQDLEICT